MKEYIEDYTGFVDRIDGDEAHVTLTTADGTVFHAIYPAAFLTANGVRERRRFIGHITDRIGPVPDREISEDEERAIGAEIEMLLGDDDEPQDDY